MINKDEIAYKLIQALLVWKKQGGPKSISVAKATMIARLKNPEITESDMISIVESTEALDLRGDEIILSSKIEDIMDEY